MVRRPDPTIGNGERTPSRFLLDPARRLEVDASSQAVFLQPEEIPWQKIVPELGERSPDIVILHVSPTTGDTTLMIRTPRNFHVPKHWHSHGEKHMVVSGTFIFECEGRRIALRPGAFNYLPPRVVHEAWTARGT